MTQETPRPDDGRDDSETGWWLEWHAGGQTRRVPLDRPLRIGRAAGADIVLDDPYASREHCTIDVVDGRPLVDARGSLNHVRIAGTDTEIASLEDGGVFLVGQTTLRVERVLRDDRSTLIYLPDVVTLTLRRSTRELVDHEGTLVARFSTSEEAIVETLAARYPDAARHDELAAAVWGDLGYDQYLIHRLLQRVRGRLGDRADLLENVRGAGYRLRAPIELR